MLWDTHSLRRINVLRSARRRRCASCIVKQTLKLGVIGVSLTKPGDQLFDELIGSRWRMCFHMSSSLARPVGVAYLVVGTTVISTGKAVAYGLRAYRNTANSSANIVRRRIRAAVSVVETAFGATNGNVLCPASGAVALRLRNASAEMPYARPAYSDVQ